MANLKNVCEWWQYTVMGFITIKRAGWTIFRLPVTCLYLSMLLLAAPSSSQIVLFSIFIPYHKLCMWCVCVCVCVIQFSYVRDKVLDSFLLSCLDFMCVFDWDFRFPETQTVIGVSYHDIFGWDWDLTWLK